MTTERPDFTMVGKDIPRVDGVAKVRGRAQFTDDLTLPGVVYARVKPASVAHARIRRIDTSRARDLPGVLLVLTGDDTPKPFVVNDHLPTEYPLARGKVRYFGEAVAAVVAVSEEKAEDALELIQVEYEELPVLLDPATAMERADVRIHDFAERNIHVQGEQTFGDVDQAFADCHLVIENTYRCSGVHGAFLEPQAALADFDPAAGKLTLRTCCQLPHYLQLTVARTLDLPPEKVRIIIPFVGGGFGGKTEVTPAALLACILAKRLCRPVKITYSRAEAMWQNKGRHPALMKLKMGFARDGTLQAADFDSTLDGGAHSSWGLVVLWFTAALAQLPYKMPNSRFRGRRVYTNKPTCGAQRGLAGVQLRMAVESLLDEAADKLGISPYEMRTKNAVETGYQTASVVSVGHSEYKRCLDSVVRRSGYLEKRGKLPFGKGIGLAGGHYSSGGAYLLYKSFRPHSTANLRLDTEAGVTCFVGATDIGQGSSTVLAQMIAEVLGVGMDDVNLVCMDTMLAPMDNGTYDSRVTHGAGHAVKYAAQDAKKKLLDMIANELGVRAAHLDLKAGHVFNIYKPSQKIPLRDAVMRYQNSIGTLFGTGEYTPPQPKATYPGNLIGPSPAFGFTAHVVEVDIDLETGKIRIPRYWEAGDCGQAINPMSVRGQVAGAISMGLGQALYEEMVYDREGRLLNANFRDYRIPTAADMPVLDLESVESYDPAAPFGNKETGECPTTAVIPAVLNAIHDAIGVRITEVPVTPEKILKALGKI